VVAVLLAAVTATGALLAIVSLHAGFLGGDVTESQRVDAAFLALVLALATAITAAACAAMVRTARGAAPRPPRRSRARRAAAALLALPFLAAGAWVSLLAVLFGGVAAQWPDPRVPDGDPCCGHPDTWGEVAEGLASAAATGYVSLALAATGVLLAVFAARGSLPAAVRTRPQAVRVAAALCLALAASVPGSWLLLALAAGDYP
jgi:hypothetical protein